MKLPENQTSATTVVMPPTDLDKGRPRSSTIDSETFRARSNSGSWLRAFARKASVDRIDGKLSPDTSSENNAKTTAQTAVEKPTDGTLPRSSSAGWIRAFTRNASVDRISPTLSPDSSSENIAKTAAQTDVDDTLPRSRHSSGDSSEDGAGRQARRHLPESGLLGLKKWAKFTIGGHDITNEDSKIFETDEMNPTLDSQGAIEKQTVPLKTKHGMGLLGFARKLSHRDLNALSPSGSDF